MVTTRFVRIADQAQLLTDPPRVGVDGLADEQFIADADDGGGYFVGHWQFSGD